MKRKKKKKKKIEKRKMAEALGIMRLHACFPAPSVDATAVHSDPQRLPQRESPTNTIPHHRDSLVIDTLSSSISHLEENQTKKQQLVMKKLEKIVSGLLLLKLRSGKKMNPKANG